METYQRVNEVGVETTTTTTITTTTEPLYKNKFFLTIFGCLQNTFAGGLIYGWTGISGTILIAPVVEGGAGLSSSTTVKIFSLASSVSCVSQFILGVLQDRCGPRLCSIVSNIFVGMGCFVFVSRVGIVVDNDDHDENMQWTYYLGAVLMGIGGPGVQMTLVHLGNLFPGRENTVMGCIVNSITFSFLIFPLFSNIWSYHRGAGGAVFVFLFRMLGAIIWLLALISVSLWPDEPYEMVRAAESNMEANFSLETFDDIDHDLYLKVETLSSTGTNSSVTSSNADGNDTDEPKDSQNGNNYVYKSMKEQLFSGKMIRLGLFFIVTSFWGNLYVATLTVELKGEQNLLNDNANDDEIMNGMIQIFSYMQVVGFAVSPIVGYLLDTIGSSWTSIITCVMGILQMFLIFGAQESGKTSIMVLSFVVYVVYRSFLYPCFFGPVATIFGFRNFGALTGIVVAFSGLIFMLLAVPFTQFAIGSCEDEAGDFEGGECVLGRWNRLHKAQIVSLVFLVLMDFKYQDVRPNKRTKLCTAYSNQDNTCGIECHDKSTEIVSNYGSA